MSRFWAKVQTYPLLLNPGQMAAVDAFLDSQWHLPLLASLIGDRVEIEI